MRFALGTFFVLPVIFAGLIVLQVYLSKMESKWPGLVLPGISFIISLVYVLGVAVIGDIASTIVTMVLTFLLSNIPTAVFLIIYAACRGKRKRQRDLGKMSVQDLE